MSEWPMCWQRCQLAYIRERRSLCLRQHQHPPQDHDVSVYIGRWFIFTVNSIQWRSPENRDRQSRPIVLTYCSYRVNILAARRKSKWRRPLGLALPPGANRRASFHVFKFSHHLRCVGCMTALCVRCAVGQRVVGDGPVNSPRSLLVWGTKKRKRKFGKERRKRPRPCDLR